MTTKEAFVLFDVPQVLGLLAGLTSRCWRRHALINSTCIIASTRRYSGSWWSTARVRPISTGHSTSATSCSCALCTTCSSCGTTSLRKSPRQKDALTSRQWLRIGETMEFRWGSTLWMKTGSWTDDNGNETSTVNVDGVENDEWIWFDGHDGDRDYRCIMKSTMSMTGYQRDLGNWWFSLHARDDDEEEEEEEKGPSILRCLYRQAHWVAWLALLQATSAESRQSPLLLASAFAKTFAIIISTLLRQTMTIADATCRNHHKYNSNEHILSLRPVNGGATGSK